MIYFIRRPQDGAIKIGYTALPTSRLAALKRSLGAPLEILAVADGGLAEEESLHRRFGHLCLGTAANHEWFSPAPELIDHIHDSGRPMKATDKTWMIRLNLTDAHRDRLRVLAAHAGMSMATLTRTVVVRYIETEHRKETAPKR